jgi:DNA polymerase-3 subunit delta
MVAIKNHEVENRISRLDGKIRVFLLYGPDGGLITERAEKLSTATGIDQNDPFSTIRLDAEHVAEDRSRLLDEAFTVGMFGGERLIRVSGTTRKNLSDAIQPVLANPPSDAWIIIEAGDLNTKSALRRNFEKSKTGMALPCYQDNDAAINQIINEELISKGYQLSREIALELRRFIGGDRMASRNELRKLALYIGEPRTVSREDLRAIMGDASSLDVNDVIDAVVAGNLKAFEMTLERIILEGTPPDIIMLGALRHFQQLHELRGQMETKRISAETAVKSARPPIFFQRQKKIERSLSRLSIQSIEKHLDRFKKAAFEARANPEIGRAIAGTNLLAVAYELSLSPK